MGGRCGMGFGVRADSLSCYSCPQLYPEVVTLPYAPCGLSFSTCSSPAAAAAASFRVRLMLYVLPAKRRCCCCCCCVVVAAAVVAAAAVAAVCCCKVLCFCSMKRKNGNKHNENSFLDNAA